MTNPSLSLQNFDQFGFMGRMDSSIAGYRQRIHGYTSSSMTEADREFLMPTVRNIDRHRILGYRAFDRNADYINLDENDPNSAHRLVSLNLLYCAENGGLKDPNAPISFENLRDPLALFNTVGDFGFTAAGRTNSDVIDLVRAGRNARNPHVLAAAAEYAGSGLGTNNEIFQQIFDRGNMSEAEHSRLLTETATAYEQMFNKPFEQHIREEFSAVGHNEGATAGALGGAVTGAVAGFFMGGPVTAIAGAFIGGLSGTIGGAILGEVGEFGMFGADDQGDQYIDELTTARYGTFNGMYSYGGMFGA